jgi:hypothetical protein
MIGAILAILAAAGPAAAPKSFDYSFDLQVPGAPPAFFRFAVSDDGRADTWKIIPNGSPISRPNTLVQTDSSGGPARVHFALAEDPPEFADGVVTVSVLGSSKSPACSSGIAARYRSPSDYVGLCYDFRRETAILFSVRGGKREVLAASAALEPRQHDWRTLRLTMKGKDLVAEVSEREVVRARDPEPRAGASGVFGTGGVAEFFDELHIVAGVPTHP